MPIEEEAGARNPNGIVQQRLVLWTEQLLQEVSDSPDTNRHRLCAEENARVPAEGHLPHPGPRQWPLTLPPDPLR